MSAVAVARAEEGAALLQDLRVGAWQDAAAADRLDRCVELLEEALAGLPPEHPVRALTCGRSALAHTMRYASRGFATPLDRQRAVDLLTEQSTAAGLNAEDRRMADALLATLQILGTMTPQAMSLYSTTVQQLTGGEVLGPSFAVAALDLPAVLGPDARPVLAGGMQTFGRIAADPEGPAELRGFAGVLAGMAKLLNGAADRPESLPDLLGRIRSAMSLVPDTTLGLPDTEALLAMLQATSASAPGAPVQAVEDAVAGLRQAADALPPGHVLSGLLAADRGLLHASLVERVGSTGHVGAALEAFQQAVDATWVGDPFYGANLRRRAGVTVAHALVEPGEGRMGEVQEAADAALRTDDESPANRSYLQGLVMLLRGSGDGDPATIGGGLRHLEDAAAASTIATGMGPTTLTLIATALLDRYNNYGTLSDLEAVDQYATQALDLVTMRAGEAGTDRAAIDGADLQIRAVRGVGRLLDGLRRRDPVALDGAADDMAAALTDLPADHMWRPGVEFGLGAAMTAAGALRGDLSRVREGATLLAAAGAATEVIGAALPMLQTGTSLAQLIFGIVDSDPALLAASSETIEAAADLPGYLYGEKARLRRSAGTLRLAHYGVFGDPADLDAAIDQLEQACELTRRGAGVAGAAETLTDLAEAYTLRADPVRGDLRRAVSVGIEALQERVGSVLLQLSTEHGLAVAKGAAAVAHRLAATCLAGRRTSDAFTVLELGRGLVLGAATAVETLPDLLAAVGRDDLAERWRDDPTGEAYARSHSGVGLLASAAPGDLPLRSLDALQKAEWGQALLSPVPVEEVAAALRATGSDALVFLLPAGPGTSGWALVLSQDGRLRRLELPGLDADADGPVAAYALRHDRYRAVDADPAATRGERAEAATAWQAALGDLCSWAWPVAVEPLLALLGRRPETPRLVLVPCGILGIVPWHAARRDSGSGYRYACHDAVWSYAAGARQYVRAVTRPSPPLDSAPVVVEDPTATLVWSVHGTEAIRRGYPGAITYGEQFDDRAGGGTPEEILAHLPGGSGVTASMLHLSCHGTTADPPTASSLQLLNPLAEQGPVVALEAPLAVGRILDQARRAPAGSGGGLVVLGACRSDLAETEHDESLTLTAAFLGAGAATVLGTRWEVPDRRAALVMVMFHRFLRHGAVPAAQALRAAQLWMLDPDRDVPEDLPAALREAARGGEPADLRGWASFTCHGR
jgi:hypothetical protein